MNNKIIFLNFWPNGGMHHYSDAVVNILSKENEVFYFSNYKSDIKSNNRFIKLSLNIFNPFNLIGLIEIVYFLIKIKPKVVHLNSGYPILFPIYPIFYFFNSIVTVHDAISHEGESLLKKIIHKIQLVNFSLFFKKIIVHSDKIKDELPIYINRNKVFVMPHVNYSHLSEGKITDKEIIDDKFKVLFFGRILEYKGLKYLIESFNFLDEDKYELIIAGEGKIDSNINKKNIKVINRFIDDLEIPIFFNEADVVVIPYLSASQSGVAYLSLAYNKPVIATNVGSIKDVIIDNINGIIINPSSAIEINNAIKKVSSVILYKRLVFNIKQQKEVELNQSFYNLKRIYYDK